MKNSSVIEDESLKSIPAREMEIKQKKILSDGLELGVSVVVLKDGNVASNRDHGDVKILITCIKEAGIDFEKKGALKVVHFNPQYFRWIGNRQKGMIKADILLEYFCAVPSDYSKKHEKFGLIKQIIQRFTTESSIQSYMYVHDVGNEGCLANIQNTTLKVAAWINSLRNQHLPSVEEIFNLLLKFLYGENILSIQPLKVIEFAIDLPSSFCNNSTICEAVILKQVYEFLTKEYEKFHTTFLSDNIFEELVNIISELLRPLIAKTILHTGILEKLNETVVAVEYWNNYAIRSNVRNHSLGIVKAAECPKYFDIICHILDTNIHILKQHRKTPIALHKLYIASVFCGKYGLKECLRQFDIGDIGNNFLSNRIAAVIMVMGIHHYQKINLSELRRNIQVQLIEYLSSSKHSDYIADTLKKLDTYKSLYSFSTTRELDMVIPHVLLSEKHRCVLDNKKKDLLLLTYLEKHIQLQQHDQWNILESVVRQLFLYKNNLCTSAIANYIRSRDFIEIMMDTEINELPYDILTKHTFIPILLAIQEKKEEKQRSLQWNNSCDAKYQSSINLCETALEQNIRMTNWSIFPQDLSQKEVMTDSELKEQIFLEFVESNCNELDKTSCHGHDEIKSLSLVNSSCHKDVEKTNLLKKMEDITRKGYQSCLGFLEIDTRENLTKAINEHNYLQFCKDKELQCSTERWSYRQPYSKQKDLCQRKNCYIQIGYILCGCEMKNISTKHKKYKGLENLCSDETCNIHLPNKNKTKLFSLEEIAVTNSSKHILFEDFQSEHIPLVKEGKVTACQFTLAERCNAVLGITFTLTQCMIAFLQKILQRNDCKQHKTDFKQHETVCKQHETEEHVRKQTATNLCLVFGIISCNQILKNIVKEKENVNIQFSGKLQKLSIHRNNGNKKLENTLQKDKLMDLYDILQTDNSKCIKSELYNIINHNSIFRNDEITAYPVNGYNGMSNEILRVGSLNNFPSENSPSLIKLAKYGFYYEGKGREVTCFSCRVKHDDWSYQSNPLEVHRQISPYCEYLKTLTPSDQPVFRPTIEIIENDCRHNATPRMPSTEIRYQNGIGRYI